MSNEPRSATSAVGEDLGDVDTGASGDPGDATTDASAAQAVADAITLQDMRRLRDSVVKSGSYLRGFTLSFRSIFECKTKWLTDYNVMKQELLRPGHVAKFFILPFTLVVITTMSRFSDKSIDWEYDQWRDSLPKVAQDAREHLAMCECLMAYYRCLHKSMEHLPGLASKALQSIIAEANKIRKEYRIVEMRSRVKDTDSWHGRLFVPLLFVPVVGDRAAALTPWDPFGNLERELEKPRQVRGEPNVCAAAVLALTESLMPLTLEMANLLDEMADVLHTVVKELEYMDPEAVAKIKEHEVDLKNFDPTAFLQGQENVTPVAPYVEEEDPMAARKRSHFKVVSEDAWKMANHCVDYGLLQTMYEDDLDYVPFLDDKEYFVSWAETQEFPGHPGQLIAEYLRQNTGRREVLQCLEY